MNNNEEFIIKDEDLVRLDESILNAEGVIKINSLSISQKLEFASSIKDKYDLIKVKYPFISIEENFVFIGALLNLLIYSFETKQNTAKEHFFKKSQFCYEGLIEKLALKPTAKVGWCYSFGLAYASSGYLENAIECLEEGFSLVDSIQDNKIEATILLLVENYLKLGLSLRSNNDTLEVEKGYYVKAIKIIDSTLDKSPTSKLYYFKAQAKTFLAFCEYRQQQFKKMIQILIEAMHINCIGLNIASGVNNKRHHLRHIKACIEKINEVLAQVENKENEQLSLIKPEINTCSDLLKNYHKKDFKKLVRIIDNLIKILNPQISEVGFFQHTSKSDKLLTKKPAILELNQYYDVNKKNNS